MGLLDHDDSGVVSRAAHDLQALVCGSCVMPGQDAEKDFDLRSLFRVQLERTLGAKRSHLDKAATFRRLRIGGPLGTDALADVADAPPYASASRTHASAYRSRWYRSGLARRCCKYW